MTILPSCTAFESGNPQSEGRAPERIQNTFNPQGQIFLSRNLKHPSLYPTDYPGGAPFISLYETRTLTLRFETLGFDSRQFSVHFTHHNPDWSVSSIPPEFFIEGFSTSTISGGEVSRSALPYYRQFSFTFPNRDARFLISGNYMVRVSDSDTGNLLFTMPFFVFENEGLIRARVETDFSTVPERRISHRPAGIYEKPDFVEQPQFDLTLFFVQNRFWGRFKKASEADFSSPSSIRFTLPAERSFDGTYDFRVLDLETLSQLNPDIDNLDLASTPARVLLDEDVAGLPDDRSFQFSTGARGINPDMDSRYVQTRFRLNTASFSEKDNDIYLTGDFNNWRVEQAMKLGNPDSDGFRNVTTLIKQGIYRYKYIVIENNIVNDSVFDNRFNETLQEYHGLVYMLDPISRYHRLLQVQNFTKSGR